MKHALDVLAIALVAQGAASVVRLQIGQERIGEVLRLPLSRRLERTVEFAVLTYAADESPQTVARVDILEDLIFVDERGDSDCQR